MKKQTKPMNPIARVVRTIKPSVVASKKGKGSYNRKKSK
jgi:stalled ribosome alternative rescue factor ArfA